MKTFRKNFKCIYLLFAFILIYGCRNNTDNKIKVGLLVAQTGYGSSFGESEKNAMELLKKKYPDVEFYLEDNKSDPKQSISAVNKLININKVNIIYTDLTTVANAVNPILANNKIIHISSVYLKSLLTNNKYALRNLPTGIQESDLLFQYINKNNLKSAKIAVIVSNDEFGNGSLEDFIKISNENNSKIIYRGVIPDENLQIKLEVSKIINLKPDMVYIGSILPNLGIVIKELRIAEFNGLITTNDAFPYPYILEQAGSHSKGTIYVDFKSGGKFESFAEVYKTQFRKEVIPSAVLCYDGLSFIIDNMKKFGNDFKPESFIGTLNGKKFEGIFGELVISQRNIIYPLEVKVWN